MRRLAGWDVLGTVVVDLGAVAFAVPFAATRLDPADPVDDHDGVVVLFTRADNDYPLETRTQDGRVVEVRVDLVDDVDEIDGEWVPGATLDVGDDGLVAMDPFRDPADRAVTFSPGAGRWISAIFRTAGDDLALRLRPES